MEVCQAVMYKGKPYKLLHLERKGDYQRLSLLSLTAPREEIFLTISSEVKLDISTLEEETWKVIRFHEGNFILSHDERTMTHPLGEWIPDCIKYLTMGKEVYIIFVKCFGQSYIGSLYTV